MQKNKFTEKRFLELNGGINTKDHPTEIEDKQMTSLSNWNFEGNKLVSSKGVNRVYNGTSPIQGMTVDGTDKWHIENGNLYKNGIAEFLSNSYTLNIENINGELFDIEIDGNKYIWDNTFASETLAYDAFVTALTTLLGGAYSVAKDSGETFINISKTDGSAITFTHPSLIKRIDVDTWGAGSSMDITIDGVNIVTDDETHSTIGELYTYIIASLPVSTYQDNTNGVVTLYRDDLTAISFSANTITNYEYTVRGWDIDNPSGINIGGTTTADVNAYYIQQTIDGINYRHDYPNSIYWPTYNYSTIIPYRGLVSHVSNNTNYTIAYGLFYDAIDAGGTDYQITSLASVYDAGSITVNEYEFKFRRNDWGVVTKSSERGLIKNDSLEVVIQNNAADSNSFITTAFTSIFTSSDGATINWTTSNTGLGLISDDFYDITISSIGTLIVSKRGFAPIFIDVAGIATEISVSIVGSPTVGTIYNGKIVLGGFSGTDNIIFSQTNDIVAGPNEMLLFTGYSAGAQSVSGGNKGEVTAMYVGENGLYVGKNNEVWYSNSEKDTGTTFNFIFTKATANGPANQGCFTDIGQDIMFFDYINRSVRRLSYEKNLTTLRDVAVSNEVESLLKAIPEDDEDNDERWSTLIKASFFYPNFSLDIPDLTSSDFYLSGINENFKYKVPTKTLIYNVENKGWTIETSKKNVLHSHKGFYGTTEGDLYQTDVGETTEEGTGRHKDNTFGEEIDYKKLGRMSVNGDIEAGEGETKTFTLGIVVDDVEVDTIEVEATNETFYFTERIPLYEKGQTLSVIPRHSGNGKVSVTGISYYIKKDNSYF